MKILPKFLLVNSAAAALAFGVVASSSAAEFSGGAYGVTANGAPSGAFSMRIGGPGDLIIESDTLSYSADYPLPDGSYRYEITGRWSSALTRDQSTFSGENGRGQYSATASATRTGVVDSGHFSIVGGAVHTGEGVEE